MNKTKLLPRDNEYRTQEQAIAYHNKNGEIFFSVSDLFNLDESSLKEIPRDWKGMAYQMTSTRIDYENNTVEHHTGSTKTKPTVIKLKNIPVCQPTYLNKLVETEEGLDFARALYGNMKAKKEKIISEFERVTGKKVNKIRIWTPNQSSRESRPVRSVGLYFYDFDRFDVGGSSWFDGNGGGLSRGVIIDSAKQSKFLGENKIKLKGNIIGYVAKGESGKQEITIALSKEEMIIPLMGEVEVIGGNIK